MSEFIGKLYIDHEFPYETQLWRNSMKINDLPIAGKFSLELLRKDSNMDVPSTLTLSAQRKELSSRKSSAHSFYLRSRNKHLLSLCSHAFDASHA